MAVSVPTAANAASTLTVLPTLIHEGASVHCVYPRLVLGASYTVFPFIVAVSVCPEIPDFTEMLFDVNAVTTPTKSSIVSTDPVGRPVRVVVAAVNTPVFEKLTLTPFVLVIALFRLKFRPIHCDWFATNANGVANVNVTVVAADAGRLHTAPARQVPIAAFVALIKIPLDPANVTLIDVYVPAGTVTPLATSEESVCNRVISKFVVVELTATGLPVVGVRLTPITGSVMLSTFTLDDADA